MSFSHKVYDHKEPHLKLFKVNRCRDLGLGDDAMPIYGQFWVFPNGVNLGMFMTACGKVSLFLVLTIIERGVFYKHIIRIRCVYARNFGVS